MGQKLPTPSYKACGFRCSPGTRRLHCLLPLFPGMSKTPAEGQLSVGWRRSQNVLFRSHCCAFLCNAASKFRIFSQRLIISFVAFVESQPDEVRGAVERPCRRGLSVDFSLSQKPAQKSSPSQQPARKKKYQTSRLGPTMFPASWFLGQLWSLLCVWTSGWSTRVSQEDSSMVEWNPSSVAAP